MPAISTPRSDSAIVVTLLALANHYIVVIVNNLTRSSELSVSSSIDDFLTPSEMAALDRPTGEAYGLPPRAYTDEKFWQRERDRLFAKTWMGCAYESDLPVAGSVFPVSIAGWEVVLASGEDGKPRAFYNICRHRSMRVVDKAVQGLSSFSCPWHAWTYDLEGRLVATPAIGGANCNEAKDVHHVELGLIAIRCDTWLGIVFINVDGQAEPLAQYLRTTSFLSCLEPLSR